MHKRLAFLSAAAIVLMMGGAGAQSPLTVAFADSAWTGDAIPPDQHCPLQGGHGATPALTVSGLPEGTASVNVAFNDESYQPMDDGGHGILNFKVAPTGGAATLPSVPGNTAEGFPEGASVATASRGTGDYASAGYLPPCSGGNGNTYTATVTALDGTGSALGEGKITLGKY